MPEDVQKILSMVLEEIRPSREDKERLLKVYEQVKSILSPCLLQMISENKATISLQGSLAKDTFLKGQSDIDVFVLLKYEETMSIEWLKTQFIPNIISCFSNYRYTLNYASHPYVTVYIDDIEVNIVPAFKVPSPDKIISAVDRTPFHTDYVLRNLTEKQKDEVRLLKKFLKTWRLYGAEAEIQGFSGYLTELMIIAYGSFYNVIKNAVNWRAYETCIDIEKYYTSKEKCLKKFKNSVLIVVDPVDPNRNAAAAVSLKSFSLFKLISRLFIESPSALFFMEESQEALDVSSINSYIDHRLKAYDSCVIILILDIVKRIPDVVWGQLNRLRNSFVNSLAFYGIEKGFNVGTWIDDKLSKAVISIEILHCSNMYKLHTGPHAYDTTNAIQFLTKNLGLGVGPWIDDDGRLYVIKKISLEEVIVMLTKIFQSIMPSSLKLADIIVVKNSKDIPLSVPGFILWFKEFLDRNPFKKLQAFLRPYS